MGSLQIVDSVVGDLCGRGQNWRNAMVFHFLAGAVAGSVFKTRTLRPIMSFVLGEAGLLMLVDPGHAGLWVVVNLTATQVGYLSGVLGVPPSNRRDIRYRLSMYAGLTEGWPRDWAAQTGNPPLQANRDLAHRSRQQRLLADIRMGFAKARRADSRSSKHPV